MLNSVKNLVLVLAFIVMTGVILFYYYKKIAERIKAYPGQKAFNITLLCVPFAFEVLLVSLYMSLR